MEVDALEYYASFFGILGEAVVFFFRSNLFDAIKIFLAVYTVVLVVDIILLLLLRSLSGDFSANLYGTNRPIISKGKTIRRWEKILNRLKSENTSEYKVAILEAEAFAEELLEGAGWHGANLSERLAQVTDAQLESRQDLLLAHDLRNRIIQDRDRSVSREEAEATLAHYRNFLEEMELL